MKKLLLMMAAAIISLSLSAEENHSIANLAAVYKYDCVRPHADSLIYATDEMMLQVAPDESRFFSVKTEFYDSIAATPGGKEMINQMVRDALNSTGGIKRDAEGKITSITVDQRAMQSAPRRGMLLNVYKRPEKGEMTVIQSMRGLDDLYYEYQVAMDDLEWMPGDSTAVILGYECQNAVADYHGRKWTAWFAPEIPVSEGPWQLYGLPGLILKAESDGGEYRFTATGVYEINERIKDMPGNPSTEKTTRKECLKVFDDLIHNPGKLFSGAVKVNAGNVKVYHDQPETDYHD